MKRDPNSFHTVFLVSNNKHQNMDTLSYKIKIKHPFVCHVATSIREVFFNASKLNTAEHYKFLHFRHTQSLLSW
jgi:hypothetical protein